eukprot:10412622-Prorocentrum_lima.AAC.1
MFELRYVEKSKLMQIPNIHRKYVLKLRDYISFHMELNFESRNWQQIMSLNSFHPSVVGESDPRLQNCTRQ